MDERWEWAALMMDIQGEGGHGMPDTMEVPFIIFLWPRVQGIVVWEGSLLTIEDKIGFWEV